MPLLYQKVYSYDNDGQRLTNQITDGSGNVRTEQYGYDSLNRLVSVNYGDGETQSYTFDAMGNRLTKQDNVSGAENYGYNNANMLVSRNGSGYVNDLDGNTLGGEGAAMCGTARTVWSPATTRRPTVWPTAASSPMGRTV
jgi:YD repeat-containing protein